MDGLECSEINFSAVVKMPTLRFDTDYYKKSYLEIEQFIVNNYNKFSSIEDLGLKVDASAFYPSLEPFYNKGNIPFIRVADVKERIDYDNCVRIPQMNSDFNTLKKCMPGDIVLTKGGRIGTPGLITEESYVTRDLIFLNTSNVEKCDYITLYLYLCSNFTFLQMLRSSSLTAQPHLTIILIKNLPIINFSTEFKKYVSKIFEQSEKIYENSKILYDSAEQIISDCLNIKSKSYFHTYNKSFSESFLVSGRLDAEYYQPKYDSLFTELNKYPCKSLGGNNGLVDIRKSIEPGSEAYQEEGVPFVRVSDMTEFEISKPDICLPINYVDDMESLYPKKDTILLSKDGSVGIAHKVNEDMQVVTSGAILHLTVRNTNEILPDYLTLVLNSQIVKLQAERDSNGAIIQHWKPSEIENVIIPILDIDLQKDIASKVKKSFALRKRSKQLLDYAKKAVEMAIEQGEDVAIKWLNAKNGSCYGQNT